MQGPRPPAGTTQSETEPSLCETGKAADSFVLIRKMAAAATAQDFCHSGLQYRLYSHLVNTPYLVRCFEHTIECRRVRGTHAKLFTVLKDSDRLLTMASWRRSCRSVKLTAPGPQILGISIALEMW